MGFVSLNDATSVKSSFGVFLCPLMSGHTESCFWPGVNESSELLLDRSVTWSKATLSQSWLVPECTMLPSLDSKLDGLPPRIAIAEPANSVSAAAVLAPRWRPWRDAFEMP
ncbi:MAG TPA: hypothetical protein VE441_09115 [Mycobacterium sp.]|nr:hypothetical protein [Mycobacterium sp.]